MQEKKIKGSIRMKLGFAFGVLMCLLVFTSFIGIKRLSIMNERLNYIVDIASMQQLLSAQTKQDILRIHRAEKNLILERKTEEMDKYAAAIDNYEGEMFEKLEKLEKLGKSSLIEIEDERENIISFKNVYKEWKKVNLEVRRLSREHTNARARELSAGRGRMLFDKVEAEMTNIVDRNDREMVAARKLSDRNYTQARNLLIAVFGIGVFVSGTLLFIIARKIAHPVRELRNAAVKIGDGKLDTAIEIKSNDEVGMLADAFNKMADNLRKSRDELISAQKDLVVKEKYAAIGRLSGTIAHDIRHPLATIKNSSYFLNMTQKNIDEKAKKHLRIIDKAVTNANNIIINMLSMTKSQVSQKLSTDINVFIKEYTEEYNFPEDITVVTEFDDKCPDIKIDQIQFRQVLSNLFSNAKHAMPEGGTLTVRTRRVRSWKFGVGSSPARTYSGRE
jgi:signal transduction histidine kinase